MKKLLVFTILLGTSIIAFSQNNYSIKGKIVHSDGYLPGGNIIALNPKDSTFIKGDFFLEGNFELNDLTTKEILLQFSSLEFDDVFRNITFDNNPLIDLGEIVVKKAGIALDEVVVNGRRTVYKQRSDGTLEVLVQNTSLAASNSANEILAKSPDIITDENGGISVFGKGNAILYLNGKRISQSQIALIAPSNIKKIEIIRNPSAKYDAEGGAVINIQTIKNTGEGYQVNLKQNVTYSDFGGTNALSSINFNQNRGRFSSNGYYSFFKGKDREVLYTTRNRTPENTFLQTDLTTDWQRDFENFSNYGLGLQFDQSKDSYLSLEYAGFSEKLGGNQFSTNKITDDAGESFYESDIERDEIETSNSLSLNYYQTFDTLGTGLFLGGQYSNFTSDMDNLISEKSLEQKDNSTRLLKNIFDLNINIYSGQTDFTKVFSNKNTLEVGLKYSHVTNNSDLDFLVTTDEINFDLDRNLSNFFNYKESIGAGYASLKGNLNENTSYMIGLRSEFTKYDLAVSSQEQLIANDYLNFFPNFAINQQFSDNYSLNFSYNARMNRPAYQRLNPVLVYQDPYTSIQGNPNLIPEKTHAFEVNTKLNKTTFKVGYNYSIDPLGARAVRGNDSKSYILLPVNYDKRHSFFSSISRTFSNDWWTSVNTLSLRQTDILESDLSTQRVPPKPNFYFYTNNTFKVSDLFNVEVLFWYLGDQYTGITHRQGRHNLTVSLEKSLLDNALKIRLIANDIFHSNIAAGDYNVGQTDIYFNRSWSTNYFRLSAMYNFGKLTKNRFKNKAIGASESDRVR